MLLRDSPREGSLSDLLWLVDPWRLIDLELVRLDGLLREMLTWRDGWVSVWVREGLESVLHLLENFLVLLLRRILLH